MFKIIEMYKSEVKCISSDRENSIQQLSRCSNRFSILDQESCPAIRGLDDRATVEESCEFAREDNLLQLLPKY